jgi:hypothetical protein
MHFLEGFERSAEMLFHHEAMFSDGTAARD